MKPLAVVAVGGNSLIKDREHQTIADQYEAIVETVKHLVPLLGEYRIVLTHGNGPQVGFILLRSFLARDRLHQVPLDSCDADTQGALGYHFQQVFQNELRLRGDRRQAVSVVTQVVVDPEDPAFANPTKPIGPFYDEDQVEEMCRRYGWTMREDAGRGWRQVVPSPEPLEIVEFEAISALLERDFIVIAVGGGGIPVVRDDRGLLHGTTAVIDKDKASSLLARKLRADLFLISTSVEHVYLEYGTPNQRPLEEVRLAELERYMGEGHFKEGSMLPKIESIRRYLADVGGRAIITSPEKIELALAGEAGAHFVP